MTSFSSFFEGDPNKEIHFTCYFQYKNILTNISNNTVSWRSSLKPDLTECLILGLRQMHTIKNNSGIKKSEKFFLFLIDFVK